MSNLRGNPSFGLIPKEVVEKALQAGLYEARKIMREYDPMFGAEKETMRKFIVTLEREKTVMETAEIEVEAVDEETAEALALEKVEPADFDEDFGGDEEYGSPSVTEVLEKE